MLKLIERRKSMKEKKILKSIIAFLLVVVLSMNSMVVQCFASEDAEKAQVGETSVEFGDGYIDEKSQIIIGGTEILIERITYEDNKSILRIKDNGKWTISQMEVDYKILESSLKNSSNILKAARRLEERYVTSYKTTEYFGPIYGDYANIVSAIGTILGQYSIPVTIASYIASAVLNNSSSPVKGHMTINRHFYGVYDSTGSFLGYYNVAYSVYTYVGSSLVDTEAGTYQSLYVG